jgi:hypothetical protein
LSWRSPFVGAPSSNHGYLGPIGREIPYQPVAAPILTNYYNKGFKIKKKLLPLSKLRGKGPRSKRLSEAVLNHGSANINSELRKQFPEPAPQRLSAHEWKKLERGMHEAKWSKEPMCNAALQVPTDRNREKPLADSTPWPTNGHRRRLPEWQYERAGCSAHDFEARCGLEPDRRVPSSRDEDKWSVGNGFHRLKAAHLLGRTSIDVEVISAPIRPDSRRGQPRRAK